MEFDEIKSSWNNYTGEGQPHLNVSEVLKLQSNSPLSAIKKRLKKQIILVVFSVLLILKTFMNRDIFHDVFFWCYLVAVSGIVVFFIINYFITGRVENMSEQTSVHLREYVFGLEKRLRYYRIAILVLFIFFILLSETLLFFTNEPMLVKWHMIHPAIRILIYILLLVFRYFASRFLYQRRYGKYLSRLHGVLDDLK